MRAHQRLHKDGVRGALTIDPNGLIGRENGGKDDLFAGIEHKPKAWKDLWSAGQGIGTIHDVPTVAELIARLRREYSAAATASVHTR